MQLCLVLASSELSGRTILELGRSQHHVNCLCQEYPRTSRIIMQQALIFNSFCTIVITAETEISACKLGLSQCYDIFYFLPPSKQPSNKEDFEFIAFCPLRRRNCSRTVAIVLKHMSRIQFTSIPSSGTKFSHGRRDFLAATTMALEGS